MDIDRRLHEAGQRWRESQGPALQPPSAASLREAAPPHQWRKGLAPMAAAAAVAAIIFGFVSVHGATTGAQQLPAGSVTTPAPSVSSPSGGRLAVPIKPFSGFVETVAVRSTLKGIEVFETEACPWIEDRVLLVFSTDASVDASGPVLISKDHRIAVGDDFESAPLVRLPGGFDCGGKHWTQAAQLPGAPLPVG